MADVAPREYRVFEKDDYGNLWFLKSFSREVDAIFFAKGREGSKKIKTVIETEYGTTI